MGVTVGKFLPHVVRSGQAAQRGCAGRFVGQGLFGLFAQFAEQGDVGRPFRPELFAQFAPQPGREGRPRATGCERDEQVAAPNRRHRDEVTHAAFGRVVPGRRRGKIDQHATRAGGLGNNGVHVGPVGRGDCQKGVVQMPRREPGGDVANTTGFHVLGQPSRRERGRDHDDVCAGFNERAHFALPHRPAAHDHAAPFSNVQGHGKQARRHLRGRRFVAHPDFILPLAGAGQRAERAVGTIKNMNTRPRCPRWAVPIFAVAGVLAAVVGLAFSTATPGGGLDPSTPRAQNGYALFALQPAGKARNQTVAARLRAFSWVRLLLPDPRGDDLPGEPGLGVLAPVGVATAGAAPAWAATVRASTGDEFPLRWEWRHLPGTPYLFVYLPPGYPNTYRWLDVRVADHRSGAAATWRLRTLPRLVHAVPPPARVSDTAKPLPGVVIKARAWWDPKRVAAAVAQKAARPPVTSDVLALTAELKTHWLPNGNGVRWNMDITDVRHEWEQPQGQGMGGWRGGGHGDQWAQTAYRESPAIPTPAAQHWAKIGATLNETMQHAEPVTFRNLPMQRDGRGYRITGRQTAKSPHSVTIEITPSSEPPRAPNEITFAARLTSARPGGARSVSFNVAGLTSWNDGTVLSSQSSNDEQRVVLRQPPVTVGGRLPSLIFLVSWETVGRTIPLTFTVPVSRGRPAPPWRR